MENMYKAFLVKYAEIAIKGKNRYIFENMLKDNIRRTLAKLGDGYQISKEQGRVFIECPDGFDYDDTVDALQHVFGVVGICPVAVIDDIEFEKLKEGVGEYVERAYEKKNFSFKVEARRADKHYPVESPKICMDMGAYLLDRFPELHVDVHNPEVRITVEVRNRGYVFSQVIPGPGGMPVGSAGRAMLLLSGGIDSPVAGWMISKRGVTLDATYFHAPPYTSERAKQKVVDLAKIISKYTGPIRLNIVNFTDIQLYIYEACPHDELTIIMRRYMMRIAERLAEKYEAVALVTGESIGQVASQTMQSLNCTNAVCKMPVFRPLIGFDKQDIVEISQKIGSFETSIQPFEDCCTIFVAKHPVTKPVLEMIEKSELNLAEKIDEMVETAIKTVEVVNIR